MDTRHGQPRLCCLSRLLCLAGAAWICGIGLAEADEYRETFESRSTTWIPSQSGPRPTVVRHERLDGYGRDNGRCEYLRLDAAVPLQETYAIDHPLPPSRSFPEVTASVWYWSNRPGAELSLRLVFPRQIDPRTRKPLVGHLRGTIYNRPGEWQQLSSQASEEAFDQLVTRLRAQLLPLVNAVDLDLKEVLIDGVTLHLEVLDGVTDLAMDDLQLSPFVPDAFYPITDGQVRSPRLQLGDDRVLLEDRPTILRFTPYHGESLDLLETCGFNIVWVRDLNDQALLEALEASRLFGMVAPPLSTPEIRTASAGADPIPFDERTAPIVMFHLGRSLPGGPDQVRDLAFRADLVRTADVRFQRGLMGDVQGSVREYHRSLDFVGFRWDVLQTEVPPLRYARFLEERRRQALPGKPTYTWLTSEPALEVLHARWDERQLPCIEPEQIFWQGYTALGAGCKGIGFFKHIPLDDPSPQAEERRLAISLFNLETRLLERWLATGKPSGQVMVRVGDEAQGTPSLPRWAGPLTSRWDTPAASADPLRNEQSGGSPDRNILGSMIDSEYGRLILLNWHHADMCYQPGRMIAEDVRVLVPGDWTQAWLITSTSVHPFPLQLTRLGGGTEVRLRELDQYAAIVLTHDRRVIAAVEQEMRTVVSEAAENWVMLASLKLDRVAGVHRELESLSQSTSRRGEFILSTARSRVDRARSAWQAGNYDESRRLAREAMMWLRILQHEAWSLTAGSPETGLVSTPHRLCFQTLPDHQRLIRGIHSGDASDNLLHSGSFDDRDLFLASGWRVGPVRGTQADWSAILVPTGSVSGYALRVESRPRLLGEGRIDEDASEVIVVESPPVHVEHGQIVVVTGKVRIFSLMPTLQNGLIIGDSILGMSSGRRWYHPTSESMAEPFTLLREVTRTGDFSVLIELHGGGRIELDDIEIRVITP